MFSARSLLASAIVLYLTTPVQAAVPRYRIEETDNGPSSQTGFLARWSRLFGKRQEDLLCVPNVWANTLNDTSRLNQQIFCNEWLELPPATTVTDVTSTLVTTATSGSTATLTTTTRTTTTVTTTETTTIIPALITPRAANAAAALAYEIIDSVIASAVESSSVAAPTPTPTGSVRRAAEEGLTTACLCLQVEPTSTVTSTNTAPPMHLTVKAVKLRQQTEIVTKEFTTTETTTLGVNATAVESSSPAFNTSSPSNTSVGGESSTGGSSTGAANAGGSSTSDSSTGEPLESGGVNAATAVITTDGAVLPLPTAGTVVVGIPFNCPGDNGKRVSNIYNDKRFEYEVFCDKAISIGEDIVNTAVEDPTACAAECSFINDAFHYAKCGAAAFSTTSGRCLTSGGSPNLVSSPGDVTAVLTGIFTPGGDSGICNLADLTEPPSNATSVDSTALVASITSATISVSTPGFVTSSGNGGEFRTRFSTGTTGTDGIYRYSWYEAYASSSSWYEVFATSWSCTNIIPRTVVVQEPVTIPGATSIFEDITTIIRGGVTTVISGTATSTYTDASGEVPPTAVPASTTQGGGAFSTGGSTATQTSTGGAGAQTPVATLVSSGALSSQVGVNATSASLGASEAQGSAFLTVAGQTGVANSTGGSGEVSPAATSGGAEQSIGGSTLVAGSTNGAGSVLPGSSGAAEQTLSGSAFTANSTGGGGSLGPQTSGAATQTVGGSTFIANSTNGAGSQGPETSGAAGQTVRGSEFTANSTGGFGSVGPQTTAAAEQTVGGSTFTANSTGGAGTVSPPLSESVIEVVSSSIITVNSTSGVESLGPQTSGAGERTVGGSTFTANSTGGFGSLGPQTSGAVELTISGSTLIANATGGAGETVVVSAPNGPFVFTVSGATATSNSTGGFGSDTPLQTSGANAFTVSSLVATANATEGGGFGPGTSPQRGQVTTGRTDLINPTPAESSAVATSEAVISSGAIIPPSNATIIASVPLGTGSQAITSAGSVSVILSTGASGQVTPITVTVESTVIVTSNVTVTPSGTGASGSFIGTISVESNTANSTGGGGSIVTSQVLPRPTSSNGPSNGFTAGAANVTSSGATLILSETGGSGAITPSVNVSQPTVVSSNVEVVLSTSTISNITISGGTAVTIVSVETGVVLPSAGVTPSLNASVGTAPGSSGIANFTSSGATAITVASEGSGAITPSANVTTLPFSLTPSPSLNVSSSTSIFSNDEGFKSAQFSRSNSPNATVPGTAPISAATAPTAANTTVDAIGSTGSGSLPVPSSPANLTSTLGTGQPSVTPPPASLNASSSLPIETTQSDFTNSEGNRVGSFSRSRTSGESETIPTPSANRTVWPGTSPVGTASSFVPTLSPNLTIAGTGSTAVSGALANSTIVIGTGDSTPILTLTLGTGSSIIPQPSVNVTASESIPAPSSNVTIPSGSGPSVTPVLSVNSTAAPTGLTAASTGFFAESANFTEQIVSTATPSTTFDLATAPSVVPSVSSNSSVSVGTAVSVGSTPSTNLTLPVPTGATASIVVPSATFNSTLIEGTGSIVIPTPSSNVTVPFSTGAAASETVPALSANTTEIVGTGSSAISTPSSNITVVIPTGSVVSATVPLVSGNSTLVGTGTVVVATPSTNITLVIPSGGTASVIIPVVSANSTLVVGTGTIAIPSPSINSTLVLGTGSSAVPSPSINTTIATGTGSVVIPSASINSTLVAGTGSSAMPSPSANSTIPLVTGFTAASVSVPAVSGNSSLPFVTGTAPSAVPTPSANFTNTDANRSGRFSRSSGTAPIAANSTAFLPTGTASSAPSVTPTMSLNSTTEGCPTVNTPFVTVRTVLVTETITPSCVATAGTGNGTFAFPTASGGGSGPLQPTYSTTVTGSLASASAAFSRYRRSGEIATQDQINAACSDTGNILFNPDFETDDDNNAFGWENKPDDSFISFRTFPTDDQHTPNGKRSGRVLTAAPGRSITISQPLTLCPGKQYRVSSFNRQSDLLASCALEYSIGDNEIFTASPQTVWLERSEFYTAGTTPQDVSVDLNIKVSCEGQGGAPVGTDDAGYMVAEFDDVSVRQV